MADLVNSWSISCLCCQALQTNFKILNLNSLKSSQKIHKIFKLKKTQKIQFWKKIIHEKKYKDIKKNFEHFRFFKAGYLPITFIILNITKSIKEMNLCNNNKRRHQLHFNMN